jgi:UDP-N-acetylmuramoylalanine--D-glutamate ligase
MAGDDRRRAFLDRFNNLRAVRAEHAQTKVMELEGKRVMVVGLGVSGRAAAHFLACRGARLVLVDRCADIAADDLAGAELHLGSEDPSWLGGVDLVVTSPGVARDSILLTGAAERGIPVVGELELASRFVRAPIVAITGTNGKSTVTVMAGEMIRASGKHVFVGGNLGTPLVEAADRDFDAVVVEVSSFQLEWIETFRPHVSVHLNLSDDHFERYRDLEDYGRTKARLLENQGEGDFAVLNRDDPNVWKLRTGLRSQVVGFGLSAAPAGGWAIWAQGDALFFEIPGRRGRIDISGFNAGPHNRANAMAAAAAALLAGAHERAIEQALLSFRPLPHRIEFVRDWRGVAFIDDSKSTNVGALGWALDAVKAPIILIAGGMDKGGDYGPLRKPLGERVKLAILIGAAREKMRTALEGSTRIELRKTLAEAVDRAAEAASAGDTVLLSPACSSFDQFRDYAERGNLFKELVRAL